MAKRQIDPMTTALLRLLVKDAAGAVVTDATATAKVFGPQGAVVASSVPLTNASNGYYVLEILPEWSTGAGSLPIQGEFRAVVIISQNGKTRAVRVPYIVGYTDI